MSTISIISDNLSDLDNLVPGCLAGDDWNLSPSLLVIMLLLYYLVWREIMSYQCINLQTGRVIEAFSECFKSEASELLHMAVHFCLALGVSWGTNSAHACLAKPCTPEWNGGLQKMGYFFPNKKSIVCTQATGHCPEGGFKKF